MEKTLAAFKGARPNRDAHTELFLLWGGANKSTYLFLLARGAPDTAAPPAGLSETMATKKNQQPAVCHGHSRPIVDLTYR